MDHTVLPAITPIYRYILMCSFFLFFLADIDVYFFLFFLFAFLNSSICILYFNSGLLSEINVDGWIGRTQENLQTAGARWGSLHRSQALK